MKIFCLKILKAIFRARGVIALLIFFLGFSTSANANWGIVDSLDLSPFIPMVLDALMSVATATYNFFVGTGDGIIYILIWGILGFSIAMYLIKLFFPPQWLSFFGFTGGGEVFTGKATGFSIGENVLKYAMKAIIAATILLQVKPTYVTNWLVNPFLEFGAIYTESILDTISTDKITTVKCPDSIKENGWLSDNSCNFLIAPIAQITHENNKVIKRGFEFLTTGLTGLATIIPNGGNDFLNIFTGILLIFAFVSSNFFMALLIIQGIFNFGMALILYPFKVLTYVAKKSEDWVNPWPAFEGIITSLRQLVITMIACAFILTVNIAIIKSLFNWNSSVFITDGAPAATQSTAMGFGQHSILWLSSILTVYLMFKIFDITKKQIKKYSGDGIDKLHGEVSGDFKTTAGKIKKFKKTITGILKKKK